MKVLFDTRDVCTALTAYIAYRSNVEHALGIVSNNTDISLCALGSGHTDDVAWEVSDGVYDPDTCRTRRSVTLTADTTDAIRDFVHRALDHHTHRRFGASFVYDVDDMTWAKGARWDPRTPDTVFYKPGLLEDITADVVAFLSPETQRRYKDLGLPSIRCYLLQGKPGVGKTTLARVMATVTHKGLAVLNKHAPLGPQLASAPPGCVCLLEDADAVNPTAVRDAIDGCGGRGVVFIATSTTKIYEDALLRRFDRVVDLPGDCSKDQARCMWVRWGVEADFDAVWKATSGYTVTCALFEKVLTKLMTCPTDTTSVVHDVLSELSKKHFAFSLYG